MTLLVILGPTGVGKSAVAMRVARRLGAEIVGCDALQVYRGLDVATAKPTVEDRLAVRHHLIDVADPRQDFNVAEYVRRADAALAEIAARGAVPIVVGGTGMYLRGLLRGLVPTTGRDTALRLRLRRMIERFGAARMHRWLAGIDAASAERLPPRDAQRIVRALELALAGGTTWTETLRRHGTWSGGAERYSTLKFGLDCDRATLAARLDARVDGFFAAGLATEVGGLLASGVPPEANALKAIGYREVLRAVLRGSDPEATRAEVQRATRSLAKRQRTWFRREVGVSWIDVAPGPDAVADHIVATWRAADPVG